MESSNKDVSGILVDVRNEVLRVTSGTQVPWEHTSLTGQVYFRDAPPPEPAPVGPAAPTGRNYDRRWKSPYGMRSKTAKTRPS